MKTSKVPLADHASHRRAQPVRQARTNPTRAAIPGAGRTFASRGSLSGGLEEKDIEIFPAITHFADAINALPKELVRHFTLLKEVDAKIYAPEEQLHRLVAEALDAPLHPPSVNTQSLNNRAASLSAAGSVNGSATNGYSTSIADYELTNPAVYDPANLPRRQLFQNCAITMQNMLVALDEKNHVISTAGEALTKQLARLDDCLPYIDLEISEEARYGSTTHWAYPENRVAKAANTGASRREAAAVNTLSAAAQLMVDEAAARSDARKQAIAEKKKGKLHAESDFDDQERREKKVHGNSKVRKAAENASASGSGVTNGATNGHPPKRRKIEKGPTGGAVMERSISAVLNNNAAKGKVASPRATPGPEGPKKRSRVAAVTNGQSRKRNNTITSAMSPSIASSPVRTTFPDIKPAKPSPPPHTHTTTHNRPPAARARQNSTYSNSIQEKRPPSVTSIKPGTSTPNLEVAALATGRTIPEVKALMKESATISNSKEKEKHPMEDIDQKEPEMVGALLVGNRKDSVSVSEETHSSTSTTKSGMSKPSTPAIPSFPEPIRPARSSRNNTTESNHNKRSHKKGAGAAAQAAIHPPQLEQEDGLEGQGPEEVVEEGEVGGEEDEPRYCYCNGVSFGEMVGCDGGECVREWFHLECVGLKVAPRGNSKWYCDDCKEKVKGSKRVSAR